MKRIYKTFDYQWNFYNLDIHPQKPWEWAKPQYVLNIQRPLDSINNIYIDPSKRLLDFNPLDNQVFFSDISILDVQRAKKSTKITLEKKMDTIYGFRLLIETKKKQFHEYLLLEQANHDSIWTVEIPIHYKYIKNIHLKADQGFINRSEKKTHWKGLWLKKSKIFFPKK